MSKKHKKHEEHEEHVNHERWLVTYADMITLLMVLFIVLFAMGQVDLKKYKALRHSLAVGFGGPDKMALLDGGEGINEGGASPAGLTPQEIAAKTALDSLEKRSTAWQIEKAKLQDAQAALVKSLQGGSGQSSISDSQIKVAFTARGLIITITADTVLFDPGSATIRREGQAILDRIAPQLVALPNAIAVEGHTDNVPISGTYPSNWELSTARASSVLRLFIERDGLPPSRGTASGYADQRPLASNATSAGRAKNRRVEIVVMAAVPDPNVTEPEAVAAANAAKESETAVSTSIVAIPNPQVTVTASPAARNGSADAGTNTSTNTPGTNTGTNTGADNAAATATSGNAATPTAAPTPSTAALTNPIGDPIVGKPVTTSAPVAGASTASTPAIASAPAIASTPASTASADSGELVVTPTVKPSAG